MCASYGLDPRFKDEDAILAGDREVLEGLHSWAEQNNAATLLPTGKNLRNLNPIIRESEGRRLLELGWWGYLIDGAPSKFPSINTRSERLVDRAGSAPSRAIVPATAWYEMQKPQHQWFQYSSAAGDLFGMAAVTQPGRTADGALYTCYSIVMRPATDDLSTIHDRVPLLVPSDFASEWLTSTAPSRELVQEALAESDRVLMRIDADPIAARPM